MANRTSASNVATPMPCKASRTPGASCGTRTSTFTSGRPSMLTLSVGSTLVAPRTRPAASAVT